MRKWKEEHGFHKDGLRLLKLAHAIDTAYIPLNLLMALIQLLLTFMSLNLTAVMIDSLLGQEWKQAAVYALSNTLFQFVGVILQKVTILLYMKFYMRCERMFNSMLSEKAMSLDYESMEDPAFLEKVRLARKTASMYGGLSAVVAYYRSILKNILIMVTSLVLVLRMCFAMPGEGALHIAAHPVVSLLWFAGLFVLTVVIAGRENKQYGQKGMEMFAKHAGVEVKAMYLHMDVFGDYHKGKVIRLFGMEDMLLRRGKEASDEIDAYYEENGVLERIHTAKQNGINGIFSLFAYLLAGVKVLSGAITIGAFTQYTGALNQFGSAYKELLVDYAQLQRLCVNLQDFLAVLDRENQHVQGSIPVEKRLDGEYELAFEDVSFHYPGSERLILEHVNCKLDMKGKMALVGRNGAGKTTFIKLLCRLYEPTEGRITLNGVDIRKYDEEEYRDLFGVVFQDFQFFPFTVRENITAGLTTDEEKLKKCITQAGAEEVIQNLSKGMDTYLTKFRKEGVEVSGGEAQKLALARALYKDAPLVILDEPTAALDPISEAAVYAGFDEMVKDKTALYISHRMSSCRFCDDILVFDEGRIAERGSHETLLTQNGRYAALWNAQAKYYTA